MACCASRCIFLTICVLQLVATLQRQVLDFLGFMWTPIITNFLEIIVTILGIFGAYQYKIKYIIFNIIVWYMRKLKWLRFKDVSLILNKYVAWTILWLAWNAFIICFYLEAGSLKRDSGILNMGTGSHSWWLVNGAGCQPIYNSSNEDPFLFPSPASVEGCYVEYFYIESIQAGVQCFLATLGIASACFAIYSYGRDDDSCSRKSVQNLPYSIEYHNNTCAPEPNLSLCQRPMTPRKVKQRSTRSKRGSKRGSKRRYYQNPVTKLINVSSQNSISSGLYPGQSNPTYNYSRSPSEIDSRTSVMFLNGRPSPIYMNESDTVI